METVFLLINSFRDGGAETANVQLANGLVAAGAKAHLVILKGEPAELRGGLDAGVRVHWLGLDGISARHVRDDGHPAVRRVRQLFADAGCGESLEGATGAVASLPLAERILSFLPPRKVVFWLHFPPTYSELEGRNAVRRWLRKRRLVKRYAGRKVAAASRGVQQDFETLVGGAAAVRTVYNPIDVGAVRAAAEADSGPTDLPPGGFFLHAGRFVPQKRHDRLLRAYAGFLGKTGSAVDLVCLGSGPLETDTRRLAADLGIADRVHFRGYVANPYPVFRRARAFVLASDFEALGMVLIEALALGVPTISTNCPWGPDEVLVGEHRENLVALDEDALCAAMVRVLEAGPVTAGYDFSRFDPVAVAEQYLDLLRLELL